MSKLRSAAGPLSGILIWGSLASAVWLLSAYMRYHNPLATGAGSSLVCFPSKSPMSTGGVACRVFDGYFFNWAWFGLTCCAFVLGFIIRPIRTRGLFQFDYNDPFFYYSLGIATFGIFAILALLAELQQWLTHQWPLWIDSMGWVVVTGWSILAALFCVIHASTILHRRGKTAKEALRQIGWWPEPATQQPE
jgi:hypothetical protein